MRTKYKAWDNYSKVFIPISEFNISPEWNIILSKHWKKFFIEDKIELIKSTWLKDKHWKSVYEWDIVEFNSHFDKNKKYVEMVKYVEDENYWGWNVRWVNIKNEWYRYCFDETDFSWYINKWNEFKIIWKIYETPNLLTNEK